MEEKIFFVEDEHDLGTLIKQYLETKGFLVDWFKDPTIALSAFRENANSYALCLLDVQMPQKNGFELAESIIRLKDQIPFVFLTARTEKQDRLHGLNIGATDYITKPFDIDELAIRLKNIIRITSGKKPVNADLSNSMIGDMLYNKENLTVTTLDHKETKLTYRESELLEYFFKNKNRRVTKEEILIKIWGENDYFFGRSLDVFISRLRKLIASSKTVSLKNVYGAGYIFNVKEII